MPEHTARRDACVANYPGGPIDWRSSYHRHTAHRPLYRPWHGVPAPACPIRKTLL